MHKSNGKSENTGSKQTKQLKKVTLLLPVESDLLQKTESREKRSNGQDNVSVTVKMTSFIL